MATVPVDDRSAAASADLAPARRPGGARLGGLQHGGGGHQSADLLAEAPRRVLGALHRGEVSPARRREAVRKLERAHQDVSDLAQTRSTPSLFERGGQRDRPADAEEIARGIDGKRRRHGGLGIPRRHRHKRFPPRHGVQAPRVGVGHTLTGDGGGARGRVRRGRRLAAATQVD